MGWSGTMTHSNSSYLLQVSGITTPMKTSNFLNAQLVHDMNAFIWKVYTHIGARFQKSRMVCDTISFKKNGCFSPHGPTSPSAAPRAQRSERRYQRLFESKAEAWLREKQLGPGPRRTLPEAGRPYGQLGRVRRK